MSTIISPRKIRGDEYKVTVGESQESPGDLYSRHEQGDISREDLIELLVENSPEDFVFGWFTDYFSDEEARTQLDAIAQRDYRIAIDLALDIGENSETVSELLRSQLETGLSSEEIYTLGHYLRENTQLLQTYEKSEVLQQAVEGSLRADLANETSLADRLSKLRWYEDITVFSDVVNEEKAAILAEISEKEMPHIREQILAANEDKTTSDAWSVAKRILNRRAPLSSIRTPLSGQEKDSIRLLALSAIEERFAIEVFQALYISKPKEDLSRIERDLCARRILENHSDHRALATVLALSERQDVSEELLEESESHLQRIVDELIGKSWSSGRDFQEIIDISTSLEKIVRYFRDDFKAETSESLMKLFDEQPALREHFFDGVHYMEDGDYEHFISALDLEYQIRLIRYQNPIDQLRCFALHSFGSQEKKVEVFNRLIAEEEAFSAIETYDRFQLMQALTNDFEGLYFEYGIEKLSQLHKILGPEKLREVSTLVSKSDLRFLDPEKVRQMLEISHEGEPFVKQMFFKYTRLCSKEGVSEDDLKYFYSRLESFPRDIGEALDLISTFHTSFEADKDTYKLRKGTDGVHYLDSSPSDDQIFSSVRDRLKNSKAANLSLRELEVRGDYGILENVEVEEVKSIISRMAEEYALISLQRQITGLSASQLREVLNLLQSYNIHGTSPSIRGACLKFSGESLRFGYVHRDELSELVENTSMVGTPLSIGKDVLQSRDPERTLQLLRESATYYSSTDPEWTRLTDIALGYYFERNDERGAEIFDTSVGKHISVNELNREDYRAFLLDRFKQALDVSPEQIDRVTTRNIGIVREKQGKAKDILPERFLAHVTGYRAASRIIDQANLAGEFIGLARFSDLYPGNVDLVDSSRLSGDITLDNLEENLPGYGDIAFVYHTEQTLSPDSRYVEIDSGHEGHVLVPVGINNEHIAAICVLKTPEEEPDLEEIKSACVRRELYIPIISCSNDILFTPEEFFERTDEYKSYDTLEELVQSEEVYSSEHDRPNTNPVYTIREHTEAVVENTLEALQISRLNPRIRSLTLAAAKLHDLGKGESEERQAFSNVRVATEHLNRVRGLTFEDRKIVLMLIKYDEMLGQILQEVRRNGNEDYTLSNEGRRRLIQFNSTFLDPEIREAMILLYQADVRGIGGSEYSAWEVAEKMDFLDMTQYM